MYCSSCGHQIKNSAESCPYCGQPVEHSHNTNQVAIAGFIFALMGSGLLGFILSCVGAAQAKKLDGDCKGLAVAGIILSLLKVVFIVLSIVLFVQVFSSFGDAIKEYIDQLENSSRMLLSI